MLWTSRTFSTSASSSQLELLRNNSLAANVGVVGGMFLGVSTGWLEKSRAHRPGPRLGARRTDIRRDWTRPCPLGCRLYSIARSLSDAELSTL